MCATMLCLATVTLGVDYGWRPLPEGGMEYIIQIEPYMLDLLAKGEELSSDIPPNVRGVRSYRITVGTDELPREGATEREPAASPPPTLPRHEEPAPTPGLRQPRYPELAPGSEAAVERPPVSSEASPSASSLWDTPRPLRLPTDTQPLSESGEKPALFIDQEKAPGGPSPPEPEKQAQPAESVEEQESGKPWAPFTLALAGFFGSFGGMLYTGWLAWGYRRQYRSLLERMIEAGHRPTDEDRTAEAEAGHLPGLPLGEKDDPRGL
jgi:hypothetical protein